MAPLFQSPEDAHQDRLGLRPVLTAIGVTVLSGNYRRTNLPFGVVVIEGSLGVIQKSE